MSIKTKLQSAWQNGNYRKWKQTCLNSVPVEVHEKVCVFDMRNLVPGRRISQIYMQLTNIGYKCLFYYPNYYYWVKSCFLKNWAYYDIAIKKGTVIKKLPIKFDFIIAKKGKKTISSEKILYFDNHMMNRIAECVNQKFFYPILFHPEKLSLDIEKRCLEQVNDNRNIGVLFIGNNDVTYSRNGELIHERYNVHIRPEIIGAIKERLADLVVEPNNYTELMLQAEKGDLEQKIVVIDKFRLGDEYIELLKKSRFFICTSGVMMPFCHNHIESIACGCVPIIEFSHLYPEMETIAANFKNIDELIEICTNICKNNRCNGDEYKQQTLKVKEYYCKYWSFEQFKKKIDDFMHGDKEEETYYVAENYRRGF